MLENTIERVALALEKLVVHVALIQENLGIAKHIPSKVPVDKPPVVESRGNSKTKAPAKTAKKGAAALEGTAAAPAAAEQLELDISLDEPAKTAEVEVEVAPAKPITVQDCRDALEKHHQMQGIESAKEILREFKSAKVSLVPEADRTAFVARCLGEV